MSRGGDSASRGGSRRGQDRGGFGGPGGGGDAWQNVSKVPARPADMSSFGKINAASGPTSFGPNSIFGKKKGGKASGETTPPPISRTPSSNMFSALEGHDGQGEPAGESTDGAPQIRKRLQLQPRTVSTEGDKAEEEVNATSELAPVEESSKEMSEEDIDRKIKNDVEELWGAKDQGGTRNPSDIAEYFETLPESARVKLAAKLVEDVLRINKTDDAQVVIKGFKLAMEKNVFTTAQAKDA
jgi:translation initiation factor 4G